MISKINPAFSYSNKYQKVAATPPQIPTQGKDGDTSKSNDKNKVQGYISA